MKKAATVAIRTTLNNKVFTRLSKRFRGCGVSSMVDAYVRDRLDRTNQLSAHKLLSFRSQYLAMFH